MSDVPAAAPHDLAVHDLVLPDLVLPDPSAQVIEVTGEDRLSHLDATTTQALADARPGTATAALVLDANGNPQAVFDVLVLPDRLWIVTPSTDVTDAVMHLIAGRTFLADARFALLDGHVVARAAVQATLLREAFSGAAVVPEPGTVRSTPSGSTVIAAAHDGALTLAGPAAEVTALLDRLRAAGAADADAGSAAAWRIAVGRPAWGVEVAPPHLPEEFGLLPTHVHLAKGCYPGQEAVARMWMLGRPRRRLARVLLTGDAAALAAVVPGWRTGEGRDAVEVTALAPARAGTEAHAGTEARLALAFVPGSAAVGDHLGAAGSEAAGTDAAGPAAPEAATPTAPEAAAVSIEVLEVLGDDPVPPGHDPAMRRRRDRDRSAA